MTDTDFRPLAFFVADHAAVENGKLYVNGGFWNRLAFPSFPAMLSFSIVAVVEVPWRAYHQPHKFTVRFEDADGHPISGFLEGEFQVGAAAELKRGDPTPLPFAAQVNNFAFQRAGEYAAVLEVDGTEIDRWRIRVVQTFVAGLGGPPRPTDLPPPVRPTESD